MVRCPSVCLSVPFTLCNPLLQVCCCSLDDRQEISINCCTGRAQQLRHAAGKCGQWHVVNKHTKLNTDLFISAIAHKHYSKCLNTHWYLFHILSGRRLLQTLKGNTVYDITNAEMTDRWKHSSIYRDRHVGRQWFLAVRSEQVCHWHKIQWNKTPRRNSAKQSVLGTHRLGISGRKKSTGASEN